MKQVILSGIAAAVALFGGAAVARAQDAVKVDAKHYTVAYEDNHVRVLKVHYGPGEKSVMHSHPDTVAVFVSDAKGKFNFPNGTSKDFNVKTGEVMHNAATVHLPENTGDQAWDVVVVELKGTKGTRAKK